MSSSQKGKREGEERVAQLVESLILKKAYHKLRPYTTTKETQKAMIMAHYKPQLTYLEDWNIPLNDSFELVFVFGSLTM